MNSDVLVSMTAGLLLGLVTVPLLADETLDGTQLQAAPRRVTIVTLGDSITKGVRSGVTAEQTFAALIETQVREQDVQARVINVGIGGERTDQALLRLDQILEQHQPDLVTVMYGTNDSYVDQGQSTSRISEKEYRQNLEQVVTTLLRRGILPVLMTEPRWADDAPVNGVGENPNLRLEAYVVACRETANAWRVPLVDHFADWTAARDAGTNLREWTTDGCHPNPAGHRQLAAAMRPVIRQAIGPKLNIRQKLLAGAAVRVVCFGDSVTGVYYHTGSRRAYADMLSMALGRAAPQASVQVINAGISGHTTVDGLARIDRDVLDHKPDLVTVMFGLNDMTRVPLNEYRANLKEIVTKCRAAGSEVVLATPNNVITTSDRPTEKLIQYCDVVREIGRALNVPVCDTYREFEAVRAVDGPDWRLLMSDTIHPNMDGHKRIATALAQTITGQRVELEDVPPPQPVLANTWPLLRDGRPVRVLAMPPFDKLIGPLLRERFPTAEVSVVPWPVAESSLAQIEQDAKARVRPLAPDLVLIAIPSSAAADSDEAFINSYSWVMNWSLNFGSPTWDCVVVHPSVTDPEHRIRSLVTGADLIRRLVRAQDLSLIDRPAGNHADVPDILRDWLGKVAQQQLQVHLDPGVSYQTIDGFGASDAWRCQFVGKNWPLEKREHIADLLFSQELDAEGNPQGIGLSIWRFYLSAGTAEQGDDSDIGNPWRRGECFQNADGTYDWTKQAGQRWFLTAARERGVECFLAFPNAPPVHLSKNGKGYATKGDIHLNVKPGSLDDYANYLVDVIEHFSREGIDFDYLSPINEPQWNWDGPGQEGTPALNEEIHALVRYLSHGLSTRGLNTRIVIGEAGTIGHAAMTMDSFGMTSDGRDDQARFFFREASPFFIGDLPNVKRTISAHSYQSVWPLDKQVEYRYLLHDALTAANRSLGYWQSEYCILQPNGEIGGGGGRDLGMNTALYVARIIHHDLTIAHARSWQWWTAISQVDFKDGLVYLDDGSAGDTGQDGSAASRA